MRAEQILAIFEQVHSGQSGGYYGWLVPTGGRWEASWNGGQLELTIDDINLDQPGDDLPVPEISLVIRLGWTHPDQDPIRLEIVVSEAMCEDQILTCLPSSEMIDQTLRHWLPDAPPLPSCPITNTMTEHEHDFDLDCWRKGVNLSDLSPELHYYGLTPPGRMRGRFDGPVSIWAQQQTKPDQLLSFWPQIVQCRINQEGSVYRQEDGSWADTPPRGTLPCLWIHTVRDLIQLWQLLGSRAPLLVLLDWELLTPRIAASLTCDYLFRDRTSDGLTLLVRRSRAKSARQTH